MRLSFKFIIALLLVAPGVLCAERQMEKLGRGVVALAQTDGKVFVSWRLLGTDADDVAFNVFRATDGGESVKLNAEPLRDATCFADANAPADKLNEWFVQIRRRGRRSRRSSKLTSGMGR